MVNIASTHQSNILFLYFSILVLAWCRKEREQHCSSAPRLHSKALSHRPLWRPAGCQGAAADCVQDAEGPLSCKVRGVRLEEKIPHSREDLGVQE